MTEQVKYTIYKPPTYTCPKHGSVGEVCFQLNYGLEPITNQYCIRCFDELLASTCQKVTKDSE